MIKILGKMNLETGVVKYYNHGMPVDVSTIPWTVVMNATPNTVEFSGTREQCERYVTEMCYNDSSYKIKMKL